MKSISFGKEVLMIVAALITVFQFLANYLIIPLNPDVKVILLNLPIESKLFLYLIGLSIIFYWVPFLANSLYSTKLGFITQPVVIGINILIGVYIHFLGLRLYWNFGLELFFKEPTSFFLLFIIPGLIGILIFSLTKRAIYSEASRIQE